ncbi:type IV conjugative transfer system protein TraL [Legionella pneumophila serogroup 1]|uniref:type IV conjugative transfer system protein TraL n=1 Tax=Fluoribacter dumoffii TaxID=463 RepID=UPI00026C7753|nr:type IV conjugative transfer system protein TraL [Fluoribacter dumoffii]
MSHNYSTFMLSEEPRIAGIPLTTGLPVYLLTGIGLLIGYAPQLFVIGAILSLIMHVQYGGLPLRVLLGMIYWSLPHAMTTIIFRSFPNSAHRIYVG